ncbi:MAG TPA: glycosyltransferase [Patescibacteria group bacterium]|nr:glycosyltransferase [Patescibacteria group bacterium]
MTISLIIPCYNEEVNIAKGVLDTIGNFTKNDARFAEVLIIDDGSIDHSKKIIQKKYLTHYKKFRLIENSHQGKAYAIITGIHASKGEYIFFSDFDLATPIEESEKLIHEMGKGNDIVIGSRKKVRKGAPFLRKLMAVGFIFIRNVVIGLKGISDTQCGFKLFNRNVALALVEKLRVFHKARKKTLGSSVTAGFDLEVLFLARKLGYTIKETQVIWNHVETKRVNFIRDSLEAISDILKIKWCEIKGEYR